MRRVPGAGALGYVLKSDLAPCLVKAVNDASKRNRFLSPKVSQIVLDGFLRAEDQTVPPQASQVSPTVRETQVNRLPASGKTNKEIAAVLGIVSCLGPSLVVARTSVVDGLKTLD